MSSVSIRLLVAGALVAATLGCGDDGTPMVTDSGTPMVDAGGDPNTIIVTEDITADANWTADKTYILQGKIFVTGGTLTIAPGTLIKGAGESALIVSRSGRIMADGTAADPIVFTSNNPVGMRERGDWAGLVLLGSASFNDGDEDVIEGIDPGDDRGLFGGTDDAHNCGTLRYVRIEFAGDEFSVSNELNGLTLGGCGTGTTIDFLQVHAGKDDGIEFFGGTAGMKHVVISRAGDDSLDWDLGWRGNVQYMVIQQDTELGDNAFESDNNGDDLNASPRSMPVIYNATMSGHPGGRGMKLREGTWGVMRNLLIMNFGVSAVDVIDAETAAGTGAGDLTIENSMFFNIGDDGTTYFPAETGTDDDDGGFDEEAFFMDVARMNIFGMNPELGDGGVPDGSSPAAGAGGAAPSGNTFIDTVDYIGAFEPGGTDWTAGWTAYPEN